MSDLLAKWVSQNQIVQVMEPVMETVRRLEGYLTATLPPPLERVAFLELGIGPKGTALAQFRFEGKTEDGKRIVCNAGPALDEVMEDMMKAAKKTAGEVEESVRELLEGENKNRS